jgi:hypothetical protein
MKPTKVLETVMQGWSDMEKGIDSEGRKFMRPTYRGEAERVLREDLPEALDELTRTEQKVERLSRLLMLAKRLIPTADWERELMDKRWEQLEPGVPALLAQLETLRGQLLHAESHDCTRPNDGEHGEERTWSYLTPEQQAWWIVEAKEESA